MQITKHVAEQLQKKKKKAICGTSEFITCDIFV